MQVASPAVFSVYSTGFADCIYQTFLQNQIMAVTSLFTIDGEE